MCPVFIIGWNTWCFSRALRWTGQAGHICGKVCCKILWDINCLHRVRREHPKPSSYSVFAFSVVKKVAQYMADVLEDSRDKVQENLLANGGDHYQSSLCLPSYKHQGLLCAKLKILMQLLGLCLQLTWLLISQDFSGTWPNIQLNSHWKTSLRSSPRYR